MVDESRHFELQPSEAWSLEWQVYAYPLPVPLHTHHGLWSVREGILLRLTDQDGRVGYGEIAPIPWFGSESLPQAREFCRQLPSKISVEHIVAIPSIFPACQFGFESAWADLTANLPTVPVLPEKLCALLPPGAIALQSWRSLWAQGYRTFKWKIAVAPLAQELAWFEALAQALPTGAKLRLDANGGLTELEAKTWLAATERTPVEFLEQPLPPDQFAVLQALQEAHSTAIALDESVATLAQLQRCYDNGWCGVLVIKPAIAGSPTQLRKFCQAHPLDLVFSSALETAIGRQAGLRLAAELGNPQRALGYGTQHWLQPNADDPTLTETAALEQAWQRH